MRNKNLLFAYTLLIPSILYVGVIFVLPIIETFRLSLTDTRLSKDFNYVGFENYVRLFANSDFWKVIVRTFVWTGISVCLKMILGLTFALLLNQKLIGRRFFRPLILPPWVVPIAICVFAWTWMYNGQYGMFSGISQRMGFGVIEFLASRNLAFMATIIVDVWVGLPMVTLFALAALQGVPKDLYEAAFIDSANRRQRFMYITFPQILPLLLTMTLLSTIWTFNSFEIIWVMTGGGPTGATNTLVIDSYRTALARFRFGDGAARAICTLVILGVFSVFYLRIFRLNQPVQEN